MKLKNIIKLSLSAVLALGMSATLLTGCGGAEEEDKDFSYSGDIADNGYWKDITAKDYVPNLPKYSGMEMPKDVYEVSDEAVQAQIDTLTARFSKKEQITDRAVADGDTVNIDYVGSVDGVEFEGGSTGGGGQEVTIGQTPFIEGFLEQIVNHQPGETFDINVTFPDPYENSPDLAGKPAVFVITINYIVGEIIPPRITDDFVSENFSTTKNWSTAEEMEEGVRKELRGTAVRDYLYNYFTTEVEVTEIPEALLKREQDAMVHYHEEYAAANNMSLEDFLSSAVGVSSVDELIESSREANEATVHYSLVMQAIAEDADISVSEDEVKAYFLNLSGSEDYSTYEEQYGKPMLVQTVLQQKIIDKITEEADVK